MKQSFDFNFEGGTFRHETNLSSIIEGLSVLSNSICIAKNILDSLHESYLWWKCHINSTAVGYPFQRKHSYGVFRRGIPSLVIISTEEFSGEVYFRSHTVQLLIGEQRVGALQKAFVVEEVSLLLLFKAAETHVVDLFRGACLARVLTLV